MIYDNRLFGKQSALKLALAISVLHFFIMLVAYAFVQLNDTKHGVNFRDLVPESTIIMFFANALLLYILFLFQFWAVKRIRSEKKRMLVIIAGLLILVFLLSPLFSQMQLLCDRRLVPEESELMLINFIKDIVLAVITLLFTLLMYAWDMHQKSMMENQKLSMRGLQDRYNALKNQVDPHFLFNSLNTLNGLIGYDDEKAHEYISQLSSIFRYTMQHKQVQQMREELDFAKSYIYLMKMRYHESLQITYRLDEKYLDYYILPFALQSLIENAVKHNVISNKYPLSVTIETTADETVCITNSLRAKENGNGSGIGLSNLDERYRLIFDKKIKISRDTHCFRVEIPLIRDMEMYQNNEI
jgi:sensor histidine kinase YesM